MKTALVRNIHEAELRRDTSYEIDANSAQHRRSDEPWSYLPDGHFGASSLCLCGSQLAHRGLADPNGPTRVWMSLGGHFVQLNTSTSAESAGPLSRRTGKERKRYSETWSERHVATEAVYDYTESSDSQHHVRPIDATCNRSSCG